MNHATRALLALSLFVLGCGDDDGDIDAGVDAAADTTLADTATDTPVSDVPIDIAFDTDPRTAAEFCSDYETVCFYGGRARFDDETACLAFYEMGSAECQECIELELALAKTGANTHCPHPGVPGNPCGDECF